MVSLRLGFVAAALGPLGAGALIVGAACARGDRGAVPGAGDDTSATGVAAQQVRSQYRARDIVAAGAWTWVAADGSIYVLIDAQSAIMDLVQARAELWRVTDSSVTPVGRSDVMSSAAEFGAYTFEDLTGDGVPDFFGYVADSAGVSYPVFLPGARGGLTEELAPAAPGWRFATEDPDTPQIVRGPGGACALQLRATDAPPDGQPEGWRYLALFRSGTLGPPRAVAPDCGLAGPSSGVQPDSPRP